MVVVYGVYSIYNRHTQSPQAMMSSQSQPLGHLLLNPYHGFLDYPPGNESISPPKGILKMIFLLEIILILWITGKSSTPCQLRFCPPNHHCTENGHHFFGGLLSLLIHDSHRKKNRGSSWKIVTPVHGSADLKVSEDLCGSKVQRCDVACGSPRPNEM